MIYIKKSLINDNDRAYSIRIFLAYPQVSYFSIHFQVKINICE